MRCWILLFAFASSASAEEQLPFNSPKWPVILAEEHQLPEKLCEFTHWKPGLKLADVKKVIEKQHGIKVRFDRPTLELQDAVGFSTQHRPLFQALDELVNRHDFKEWQFKKGVLRIHCDDIQLLTQLYPVKDFLTNWTKKQLIRALTNNTIGPWFELDGLGGTVHYAGPMLMVRQTARVHREIRHILSQLRAQEFPCQLLQNSRDKLIQQRALEARNVSFGKVSLTEFARRLSRAWNVDVDLDEFTLEQVEDVERSHEYQLSRGTIKTANKNRLTVLSSDGRVIITSLAYVSETFNTEVHQVKDLFPYFLAPTQLTSVIQDETPGPWLEIDGLGGEISLVGDGLLFIRHTKSNLRTCQRFLNRLRRNFAKHPDWHPKDELVARSYRVPDDILPKDFESLLRQQIAPESWNDSELKVFAVLQSIKGENKTENNLLIHHLESVHIQIEKLVTDLNHARNTFSGGGFF